MTRDRWTQPARVACGLLFLAMVPIGAAKAEDLPSAALPAELSRVLTDYETAWQRRDARALSELFAEDGFVLPRDAPPARGRANIEAHYRGQGGPLSLRALHFAMEGSTGFIIGGYASGRAEPDIGKFTLTLRRANDGRWLIVSDMDSGNSPPRRSLSPALVAVSVRELAPMLAWYRDTLGYAVKAEQAWPEHHVKTAIVSREGFDVELIERQGSIPLTRCLPSPGDVVLVNGFKKLALSVPDLDGWYSALKERRVTFVYPDIRTTGLGERYVMVEDPEGNVLQFFDEATRRH